MKGLRESFSAVTDMCCTRTPFQMHETNPSNLDQACSYLTIGMMKTMLKSDRNMFFSPTSVQIALGISLAGPRGKTAKQIMDTAFRGMDESAVHDAMQVLLRVLDLPNDSFHLHAANRMYGHNGFPVKQGFVEMVAKYYGSSFKQVDFVDDVESAAEEISAWVSEQTEGKIENMVNVDILKQDTKLLVVNAMYFKARWAKNFMEYNTNVADFEPTPTSKMECHMMEMKNYLPYHADDHCRILMLPYEADGLAMMLVLGKKRHAVKALINEVPICLQRMTTQSKANNILIHCKVPKFTIETKCSLKEVLRQMGMHEPFEESADFSRISSAPLHVSDIIHQAFLAVNEDGTEAAAATAISFAYTCLMIPPAGPYTEFFLDEPFLMCIMQKGRVLFSAFITDPSGVGNQG